MKLVKCKNGHYYNAEKYDACPHCTGTASTDYLSKMHMTLPSELDFFEVGTLLGESKTSKVFHMRPREEYALKVVDITEQETERVVDNEYRIARMLYGERGFVRYHALYKQGNKAYIVLQEMRNLPSFLRERQPVFYDRIRILKDVAEAVEIMHKKGIAHLDIKPANIFVDNEGHGRIGDFSAACEINRFSERPFRGGTSKYLPPEIYKAEEYSGREDIYSFGIMMYYILSGGKYPYDYGEDVTRSESTKYISDRNISDALQMIIKKATAYDPKDRYESIQEIRELLSTYSGSTAFSPSFMSGDSFHPEEADSCKHSVPLEPEFRSGYFESEDDYSFSLSSGPVEHASNADAASSFSTVKAVPMQNEQSELKISNVHFSAVAPRTLIKGDYTMIDIVMYQKEFRTVVEEIIKNADVDVQEVRSGAVKVKEDARIKIVLSSPDIQIEDNVEEQEWVGEYLMFNFAVMLPEKYAKRQVLFTAAVYINDVIATRLKFIAKCRSFRQQKISVTQEDIRSAFVSYASEDRNRVASIIQGMQKARPDMDIFFDVENLRSGEAWEEALWAEIEQRDVLFLCWSRNAKESKWVEAEWRYAYEQKGIDAIEPIPLETPKNCPPPAELEKKHFNDKLLYVIATESAE